MTDIRTITLHNLIQGITRFFFGFYVFYCFFEPYINIVMGSFGSLIIFILIFLLIISHKRVCIRWYHVTILLWLLMKIVSILWVPDNFIYNLHFVSVVGMAGLYLFSTGLVLEDQYKKVITRTLLYSSSLMGILSIFLSFPYRGEFISRQVLTIGGAQLDPNNQAAFLVFGVGLSIYYLMNPKVSKKYKVFLVITVMINIYATFLTGSRGGFVSIGACVMVAVLFIHKGDKLISASALRGLFGITILAVLVFFGARNYLPLDIFERLFMFSGYEGGSERIDIWLNTIGIFFDNPLIGGGWGSFWGYNDLYRAVHNTYLAELTDTGLIGFSLFISPFVYIGLKSLSVRYFLPVIVLFTGAVPSLFIDSINKRFFWNAFILSLILLQIELRRQYERKHSIVKPEKELNLVLQKDEDLIDRLNTEMIKNYVTAGYSSDIIEVADETDSYDSDIDIFRNAGVDQRSRVKKDRKRKRKNKKFLVKHHK